MGLNLFPEVVVDRRSKRDKVGRFMSCFHVSSDDISTIGFQFITLSKINYSMETNSKQEKATIPLMPNIGYFILCIFYICILHITINYSINMKLTSEFKLFKSKIQHRKVQIKRLDRKRYLWLVVGT